MRVLNYKQFNESKQDIDSICKKYGIENYTINQDGSIDVDENVNLSYEGLAKLPLKFRNVSGYFSCHNNQLTTLEGCPQSVGGGFYCYNNQLKTLEGAPTSVGGDFYCHKNKLTTLEGAPNSVGGNFRCENNQLTSLEGAPTSVGGDFSCYRNQLGTLEGCPQSVGGHFDCSKNQLKTLKGAPTSVGGNFHCRNNQLIHFEGFPPLYDKTKNIYCERNPVEEIYSLYNTIECAEWLNEEEVINYKDQDGNLLDRPFVYYMKLKDVYDYLEMKYLDIDEVRSRLKHYEVIG